MDIVLDGEGEQNMSPKYTKVLLCLANSRKISGRCLAGKEIDGSNIGGWIRPISTRPTGELSEEDRRFQNGQDPKLLDIIRIPMIEARPHTFQTENHLIDDRFYWMNEGKATLNDVRKSLDKLQGPLWDNSSSSYNGTNDRVAEIAAGALSDSLKLVEIEDLRIEVGVEGAEFNNAKRKVRGHFTLGGMQYKLAITDPIIERQYFAGEDGYFQIGRAVLCISLGEPYGGFTYKLIAAVILG